MVTKFPIFEQNDGLTPLEECQFCAFLKPMFLLFTKACFLYKTSKIAFLRFISRSMTWEYRGLQGVQGGYKALQGVTRGYKALQGVTGGYNGLQQVTGGDKGLQQVTCGDKGLQGVTKDYRNFFLTRTFPDTFSCFILHKNQS